MYKQPTNMEVHFIQFWDRYIFCLCDVVCIKLCHCLFTNNY